MATGALHLDCAKRAIAQVGQWNSEEKIPLAGFNLGKFVRATAQANGVEVASYSAGVVEAVSGKSGSGDGGRSRSAK